MEATEIIKILEDMKDNSPYPLDIFTEPTEDTRERVKLLLKAARISQDSLFGWWARYVHKNTLEDIIRRLKEHEKE